MTELELRNLKVSISNRLNNILCEMKPGYDDSITGFNEAWDAVGKLLDEKIERAERANAHCRDVFAENVKSGGMP